MTAPVFRIFGCADWRASPPTQTPTAAGKPDKILFHHTYGHAPDLDQKPTQTFEEAAAYARAIQRYHKSQGWIDSGHNFLVSRGGYILEGRHGTIAALTRGRMVVSAHCPGQNDQPGVEHEHRGEPEMTAEQRAASVWLHTWICQHARTIRPTEIFGHGRFYPTSCPAELEHEILPLRAAVARELTRNPYSAIQGEMWRWFLWRDRGAIAEERPLTNVRRKVPQSWWPRYYLHRYGRLPGT